MHFSEPELAAHPYVKNPIILQHFSRFRENRRASQAHWAFRANLFRLIVSPEESTSVVTNRLN